jgi:hypothetical protein
MKKLSILISTILVLMISCNEKKTYNVLIGQKITTSSEHPDYRANTLVDSNETFNIWNNGKFGQDWIQVDLDKSFDIDTISFDLVALPPSTYNYDILVKKEGEEFKNIESKTTFVNGGLPVQIIKEIKDVNSIKIVVKNDSSFTALYSLKAIGN